MFWRLRSGTYSTTRQQGRLRSGNSLLGASQDFFHAEPLRNGRHPYQGPPSSLTAGTYTIGDGPPASTPTFSPAAGTYSSAQSVTISDATSDATIYYTTNGTTPTTSSTEYTGPITVSSTETLKAIAAVGGDTNSAVASADYTVTSLPSVSAEAYVYDTVAAGTYVYDASNSGKLTHGQRVALYNRGPDSRHQRQVPCYSRFRLRVRLYG